MNPDVPYLPAIGNMTKILDAIQNAAAPAVFNVQFLKDLGFTSSQDRPMTRILKYLGMLDSTGKPTTYYREFMDGSKAKRVLANRMRFAFDDLFNADRGAHTKSAESLKGWFKTKTGASDSVAKKIASNFKTLATYADFASDPLDSNVSGPEIKNEDAPLDDDDTRANQSPLKLPGELVSKSLGLVWRLEIHLPDTTNVDTHRAIFKALHEELM